MATVRELCTDALLEIGVLGLGDTMDGTVGQFVLGRFQRQLDSWKANRLTLSVQTRTPFTLSSGQSTKTIGATGADITLDRPLAIDYLTCVIPSSSPSVESTMPLGRMSDAQYAALSVKALSSSLPTLFFYE